MTSIPTRSGGPRSPLPTAGCTPLWRTPRTGDLRGQGAFVSRSGDPAGPWTRIADVDKLASSDSALGDSTSAYYPGVQADYNQNILADPKNRQHVYLQLEEVYESTDGGTSWTTVGPYWNYDITCEEAHGDPYACPPTTHPDQHAGMIYRGQFWAGNDGGVWRRPLSRHNRGHWTNLNAHAAHPAELLDRGRPGRPGGLAYWGGLQDNGESYTRTDMTPGRAGVHRRRRRHHRRPDGRRPRRRGVRLPGHVPDHRRRRPDVDGDLPVLPDRHRPAGQSATPTRASSPRSRWTSTTRNHWVAGGQYVWDDTKSWDTVCNSTRCDWKKVYDTGAGHQVTALAANGERDLRRVVRAAATRRERPFVRGLATNYGGTWHAAVTGRRAQPLHHLARRRPGQRGARLHQRRLLQPSLDP